MAVDSVVEVLGEWVVDYTDEGAQVEAEGEGDADVGVGVHEVCGAVYGVHYECGGGGEGAACGGFFAEEAVGGVFEFESVGDHVFDCFVGFGDEVGGYVFRKYQSVSNHLF